MLATAGYIKKNGLSDCTTDEYKMLMEAIGLKMAFEEYAVPAMEKNQVVMFDRYTDTYMIDFEKYPPARNILLSFPICDVSIILDIDYDTAAKRIELRGRKMIDNIDFLQKKRVEYHETRLKKNKKYHIIDALRPMDEVYNDVLSVVKRGIEEKRKKSEKILLLGYYSQRFLNAAAAFYRTVHLSERDDKQVLSEIADSEVVVFRSPFVLDDAMINAAEKLRCIIRAGSGIEGISPLYKQKDREIQLKVIRRNHYPVAELVIAVTLNALRRITDAIDSVKSLQWQKNDFVGHNLMGKTVGIIGFGAIGQRTAGLMYSFGTDIGVYDRSIEKQEKQKILNDIGGRTMSLNELAEQSDIIVLSVSYSDEVYRLVSENLLSLMKSSAIIVNVSRGKVVCDEAMFSFLKKNPKAVYATDVYSNEPIEYKPLYHLPNFMGTPHIGAQTHETRCEIEDEILAELRKLQS